MAKKENTRHGTPVHIHVHSKRTRATDADGISAKYAIDGLVIAGILPDDRPEYVSGVSYSQEITKGQEETIITIERGK